MRHPFRHATKLTLVGEYDATRTDTMHRTAGEQIGLTVDDQVDDEARSQPAGRERSFMPQRRDLEARIRCGAGVVRVIHRGDPAVSVCRPQRQCRWVGAVVRRGGRVQKAATVPTSLTARTTSSVRRLRYSIQLPRNL